MNFFKKKKAKVCSKCENNDYFTEYFNRQYTDKKLYGSKGCHKIVMANTSRQFNDDTNKYVIKDIAELTDLDYEIIGRAFIDRLYSPYFDKWECNCLQNFCENVCRQSESEFYLKNLDKNKS